MAQRKMGQDGMHSPGLVRSLINSSAAAAIAETATLPFDTAKVSPWLASSLMHILYSNLQAWDGCQGTLLARLRYCRVHIACDSCQGTVSARLRHCASGQAAHETTGVALQLSKVGRGHDCRLCADQQSVSMVCRSDCSSRMFRVAGSGGTRGQCRPSGALPPRRASWHPSRQALRQLMLRPAVSFQIV